jgi:hypothetical protein
MVFLVPEGEARWRLVLRFPRLSWRDVVPVPEGQAVL